VADETQDRRDEAAAGVTAIAVTVVSPQARPSDRTTAASRELRPLRSIEDAAASETALAPLVSPATE